jgi:hypothetical protein
MKSKDVIFRIILQDNKDTDFDNAPDVVNLDLWGNRYRLFFSNTQIVDPFDIMRTKIYNDLIIFGTKEGMNRVSLLDENWVFLSPQKKTGFKRF